MSSAARFKQIDVSRAVRGVEAAGIRVGSVQIDPNGRIVILSAASVPLQGANSWDEVLK